MTRLLADGLADGRTSRRGPLGVWVEPGPPRGPASPVGTTAVRVLHIGPPDDPAAPPEGRTVDTRGHVLLPGLVNAHTHLDLTAIGPRPHDPDAGFVHWVEMVRAARPAEPDAIRAAVRAGVERTLTGGVVAVGDILGAAGGRTTLAGLDTLATSPLLGVGFVEFFGIGNRAERAIADLDDLAESLRAHTAGGVRPGLQPHAPNTVSRPVYEHAARLAADLGTPLATHLAETAEERAFIAAAAGPQRDLLERLGIWDDRELAHIGLGAHPVEHLAAVLGATPSLAAHVNDLPDPDADRLISLLAETGVSVVYCPRASAYFGAPDRLGPHRYREMLAAGVNVCLGTDSIINLDTPDRITPLDDARLLYRRDGVGAHTLLDMITRRGARAIGLDPSAFVFEPGGVLAGLVAVPIDDLSPNPAEAILRSDSEPRLLSGWTKSDSAAKPGAAPGRSMPGHHLE